MHPIFYIYNYHLQFLTDLSISLDFFIDVGTCIPWHRSHLFRAGTVALSRGCSSLAPGTSSSVSSGWLAIAIFHKNDVIRSATNKGHSTYLPRGAWVQAAVQNSSFLTIRISQTVDATATRFALLNRQIFKFSLLFFLLEYIEQEAWYIRSK